MMSMSLDCLELGSGLMRGLCRTRQLTSASLARLYGPVRM